MSTPLLAFLFSLGGLAVGVFLNILADVLPPSAQERPALCCGKCGAKRAVSQYVPLLSYALPLGRCQECGAHTPLRWLLVEFGNGVLFALLFWRFGLTDIFCVYLLYLCVLMLVFIVDLERQLVLDVVTYPSMAAAFGLSWVLPEVGPLHSAIGGAFGLITLALPYLYYRRRGLFGFGDVLLGGLLGLMVGWPVMVLVLLMASFAGGTVGVVLMMVRGAKRTDLIPFGPFLASATVLCLFFGQGMADHLLAYIS
jgi:leader peptidase (prepilin peptidase)/N-methyltransferase